LDFLLKCCVHFSCTPLALNVPLLFNFTALWWRVQVMMLLVQ
jgi:hypothetical protein